MTSLHQSRLRAFVWVRATAVALAVLVLGHFAVTHLSTDVAETDSSFVLTRWSQVLWLAWDSAMLLAALTHAACGVWLIIGERATTPRTRRRLQRGTLIATSLLILLGTAVIAATAVQT